TNDVHTAEDVVQDVFVGFAQSAARIRPAGNLRTYLATGVANRIRNTLRDRQRHETAVIEDTDCVICKTEGPAQWAILSEELERLSEAMAQVPYDQREVIGLHMQGGMTFKQISRVQNVSINTIQGRYRYGLSRLRSILNGQVANESSR
ncbi:MAG: sigma-70 family RNA polymerase sigma factor, partial [Phycisphaerales bacterium]